MSHNSAASKIFLTDDMIGQSYLCYLLPSRTQLCMVKADIVGNDIMFGMMTSVGAKDAIDIPVRILILVQIINY